MEMPQLLTSATGIFSPEGFVWLRIDTMERETQERFTWRVHMSPEDARSVARNLQHHADQAEEILLSRGRLDHQGDADLTPVH